MAADETLTEAVVVNALGVMASSLPPSFSPVYSRYVLSQVLDFKEVAKKANDAGQGAYDAQVKNDEQDVTLANHGERIGKAEVMLTDHEERIIILRFDVDDHEVRITANTNAISLLDVRLTTAEGQIVTLQSDVDYLINEVVDLWSDVTDIKGDYVSKTVATTQELASPLDVTTSYSVGGVKVVGARVTGFTPATGTALKGAFDADQAFTVSDPPTQAEVQALAAALTESRQRNKALEDAMRTHGLIN